MGRLAPHPPIAFTHFSILFTIYICIHRYFDILDLPFVCGMLKERFVIHRMRSILSNEAPFDDVFFDDLTGIVCSIDSFVGSVDLPPGIKFYDIGWKAVTSGVSDLICKGVLPHIINFSIVLPDRLKQADIDNLALGIKDATTYYRGKIGKGDTNKGKDFVLSICAIGFSDFPIPSRSQVMPGDKIIVTDYFGFERLALDMLLGNVNYRGKFKQIILSRFFTPKINFEPVIWAIRHGFVSGSIDSSDGLARSLYDISIESNAKIIIENLPVPSWLLKLFNKLSLDINKYVFYGGEEYIPILFIRGDLWEYFIRLSDKFGFNFIYIGFVEEGSGVYLHKNGSLIKIKNAGWDALTGYEI